MREPEIRDAEAPYGDEDDREGGHAAAGEPSGTRGQLDSAGGGYGSQSGTASSGGTGDGAAGTGEEMDDGTTSSATGATDAGPTEWLRSEGDGPQPSGDQGGSGSR